MRTAVRELAIPHGASTTGPIVTASIGGATVSPLPGVSPPQLVAAADAALYRAKAAGRDRVELG